MARRLRLGVAGLGRAFTLMLPTLSAHPRIELAAAADPRPEARARFAADFGAMAALNQDEYKQLDQKAAGRATKVRIETARGPADAPAAADTARQRQRVLDEASREPAVQEDLDLFNGKVVDVRGKA